MFAKLRFCICLLFLGVMGPALAKPVVKIQTWKTSAGTPVYFVQSTQLPMVDVRVVFDAGSARDGKKPGLAMATSAMLDEGAAGLSANEIADAFDRVGAQYSSMVMRDMTVLGLRSLRETKYLNPAMNTLTQLMSKPTFPQAALSRVKKQLLNVLKQQQQSPGALASIALFKMLYGNQPYAHPKVGTIPSVSRFTQEDLQHFYRQYYVARNAMIAIVGDVDRHEAHALAEKLSHALPVGQKASPLPKVAVVAEKQTDERIPFPSEQTHVYMGQLGIRMQNPDRYALTVGNYVLGGGPLTSRLFNHVRERRGLAYMVMSTFVPMRDRGPFLIVLQTRNQQANTAVNVAKETFDRFLRQGPSAAELRLAKQHLIQGFPLKIANNSAVISQVVGIGFYGLPLNYLDTYRDNIAKVTVAHVKQAFNKYLKPSQLHMVTVGKPITSHAQLH